MSDREKHIEQLFTAELRFRLASAVRPATTRNLWLLDLPMEWTHIDPTTFHERWSQQQAVGGGLWLA